MIYGLYLSATGVITSSYRQDVIANNLANSETTGFKKDLATFYQRPVADKENPLWGGKGNAFLDQIGGGTFASATRMDMSPGTIEPTGNDLDAAIIGDGYFTVGGTKGQTLLTRDGRFRLDHDGHMTLSNDQASPVLDEQGNAITLDPTQTAMINNNGQILQNGQPVAKLGFVNIADPTKLKKEGASILSYSDPKGITAADPQIEDGYLERSNVEPTAELAQLMDTQRQLEANANMIHYQDSTLGELVNTVGKIS